MKQYFVKSLEIKLEVCTSVTSVKGNLQKCFLLQILFLPGTCGGEGGRIRRSQPQT